MDCQEMTTAQQLHQQRRALIRYCRGVEFDLALAVISRDDIAADCLRFEHRRLLVTIRVLTAWIEELRLSEQAGAALREVQRILNHHL